MTTTIPPLNIPSAVTPIYAIAPGASKSDLGEFLTIRLSHLKAILSATTGDSGEAFRGLNDTLQDEFMEACNFLAQECSALLNKSKRGSPEQINRPTPQQAASGRFFFGCLDGTDP